MRPVLVLLLALNPACSDDRTFEPKPAPSPAATPAPTHVPTPPAAATPPAGPPAADPPAADPPAKDGKLSVDDIVARLPADFRAERKSTSNGMTNVKVWDPDEAMLWGIVDHGDDELALATAKASLEPHVQQMARIDWKPDGQTKVWPASTRT